MTSSSRFDFIKSKYCKQFVGCLVVLELARAVNAKLIPSYQFFNFRRLVRLSEVLAYIQNTRDGSDR